MPAKKAKKKKKKKKAKRLTLGERRRAKRDLIDAAHNELISDLKEVQGQ